MIPTVEDILLDLAAGKISHAQAMAWMEQHFKLCAEEAFAPPEVDAIEITSAMEEAGMKEVQYQYNLPSTRAGVVAVFRAMLRAHSSPLAAPAAWVATKGDKVLHLAKADGWRVEVVQTEPQKTP